jgi:4-hydroxy-2-oxoheptanedioate aldolase
MATFIERKDLQPQAPYRAALLTYPANLRQALKDAQADPAKTLLGVGQGIGSTFVTKVMASAKPDFIWLDVEHGMFNRLELHEYVQPRRRNYRIDLIYRSAVQAGSHHSEGKSAIIVRVPKDDELSLTTALDAGAAGVVIPHCESAKDVTNMIKGAYYRE